MESKLPPAIARIRQLCAAGLPGRAVVPLVMAELRSLVPAACVQFTWASEQGRLTNFWGDPFMAGRLAWITLNHRRYEADAGIGFRELVLFGAPTGNLRRWWAQGFERSATYAAVFAPYGLKWFLDGIVRDERRPYGCVALIRRHDEPDFSADDEALLARVLPYLTHALRCEAARPRRFVRGGASGLFVCREDGDVVEGSQQAWRLATYAFVDELNLDTAFVGGEHPRVREHLRALARRFSAALDPAATGALPRHAAANGWGEFTFHGHRLEGGSDVRIGVLVEQHVPLEAHLLACVNAAPLTLRLKEIALLGALGHSNAQIARRLGITPLTLKDYTKELYARLAVSSRQELVDRLAEQSTVC